MTVNYTEYATEKLNFFKAHKNDFECNTSPMDQYGRYWKAYIFKDGAVWNEAMSTEYVQQEVEIKSYKVTVEVKMFRTEFWSTDNASSKYYYEKF